MVMEVLPELVVDEFELPVELFEPVEELPEELVEEPVEEEPVEEEELVEVVCEELSVEVFSEEVSLLSVLSDDELSLFVVEVCEELETSVSESVFSGPQADITKISESASSNAISFFIL